MKKVLLGLLIGVIFSTLFFLAKDFLTNEKKVPKNHVTVRVLIESNRKVESIKLISTYSKQEILLAGQKETLLIMPNPGEGDLEICCTFKNGEKVCSDKHYVERGYSPTLRITDTEIEIIDFY